LPVGAGSVTLLWSVQRAFALFYLTIIDMVFKWLSLIFKVGYWLSEEEAIMSPAVREKKITVPKQHIK